MISKEQFREYFNSSIYPKLKAENFKILFCKIAMIISTLLSFSFLIWSGVLIISKEKIAQEFMFVPITAIVGVAVTMGILIYYYDLLKKIQPKILKPILLKVLEDNKFTYEEHKYVAKTHVVKSKFISESIFEVSGEDYLQITMPTEEGDVSIQISDIFVKAYKPALWGGENLQVIESGIFGMVDYGKEVKAQILGNFILRGFEEMQLESMEFNNQFKCYTNDQIEARKILTPRVMSRMLKLKGDIEKKIRFHFHGNCLYFFIQKNLFKYKIKGKVDFSEAEQIYDQIYIVYEVAKEIAATKNIFK